MSAERNQKIIMEEREWQFDIASFERARAYLKSNPDGRGRDFWRIRAEEIRAKWPALKEEVLP